MKTEKILKGAICAIGAVAISSFLAYHESKTQNAEQKMSKNSVADSEKITAGVVEEKLNLVKEWDKVFPQSDKVFHSKITFHNRYGITLAADLYIPKNESLKVNGKFPAVSVSGPFGAVKEQSSGLYAQTLAERGFLTIAFDPSFTGESSGTPRNVASPDINTEDFSASVDYLSTREDVDEDRIGILGICGWGGIGINAAAMDTRIKATVASTMYDMTRVSANGYNDANDNFEARHKMLVALNHQRTKDYKQGYYDRAGANLLPEELTVQTPQFIKDYTMYYETKRGFHPRSNNSVGGWNKTSTLSFINLPFLKRSNEIQSAVLIVHGEKAHSRYFSETAFQNMTENGKGKFTANKELLIIPGASHTDLYDNLEKIPFDKIENFYREYLK